jgi:hypothetical protein
MAKTGLPGVVEIDGVDLAQQVALPLVMVPGMRLVRLGLENGWRLAADGELAAECPLLLLNNSRNGSARFMFVSARTDHTDQ